jgi:hypothetical protein
MLDEQRRFILDKFISVGCFVGVIRAVINFNSSFHTETFASIPNPVLSDSTLAQGGSATGAPGWEFRISRAEAHLDLENCVL